jgi:hypothetical protein
MIVFRQDFFYKILVTLFTIDLNLDLRRLEVASGMRLDSTLREHRYRSESHFNCCTYLFYSPAPSYSTIFLLERSLNCSLDVDLRRKGVAALLRTHSLHAGPPEVHAQGLRGRRGVLQRSDGGLLGDEPAPADGSPQGVLPGSSCQVRNGLMVLVLISVADPYFFYAFRIRIHLSEVRIRILLSSSKNSKKNLDSYSCVTSTKN